MLTSTIDKIVQTIRVRVSQFGHESERGSSLSVRPERHFSYPLRHVVFWKYRSEHATTIKVILSECLLYGPSVPIREFLLQNARGLPMIFGSFFAFPHLTARVDFGTEKLSFHGISLHEYHHSPLIM
jgi:hypothetical protein